jgi:hypothetical protein
MDKGHFGAVFRGGNLTLSQASAIFTPRLRIGRKTLENRGKSGQATT